MTNREDESSIFEATKIIDFEDGFVQFFTLGVKVILVLQIQHFTATSILHKKEIVRNNFQSEFLGTHKQN